MEHMARKHLITLEGLETRVTRIEVLLPALATKADLAAAVAPLATKTELALLATKDEIALLATKAELALLATKAEIAQLATRSEMLALGESLHDDIRILAESVLSLHAKIDARF